MRRAVFILGALSLALALMLAIALCVGTHPIAPSEVWQILLGERGGIGATIVEGIRLPRSLLAMFVGAALALAGAAFQAVLRNPLADPYILGVSGGAALGAVLALGLGLWTGLSLPLMSFLGALAALSAVFAIGGIHRSSSSTMILTGVMIGSLASAMLLFALWSMPSDEVRGAIFWLAGDLRAENAHWLHLAAALGALALGLLWFSFPALDLFTQGEQSAADLGLDVGRYRVLILGAAGLLTATAVSLAGIIGFVGLVVPHAVRLLWGPAHALLIPASALAGALFLLAADSLSRTIIAPTQLPVGIITALVGAPCFLYLLRKREVAL